MTCISYFSLLWPSIWHETTWVKKALFQLPKQFEEVHHGQDSMVEAKALWLGLIESAGTQKQRDRKGGQAMLSGANTDPPLQARLYFLEVPQPPPTGDQVFEYTSLWRTVLIQTIWSQQLVYSQSSLSVTVHFPLCAPHLVSSIWASDTQQVSDRSSYIARNLLLLFSPQMPSHFQPWVKITSTSFQLTEWPSSHLQTDWQQSDSMLFPWGPSCRNSDALLHLASFPSHYIFTETLKQFEDWFQSPGSWFSQSSTCHRSMRTWASSPVYQSM